MAKWFFLWSTRSNWSFEVGLRCAPWKKSHCYQPTYTLFMFYRSNTVSMWFFMFLRRKNIHFLAPDVPSVTQCQFYTKYFMLQWTFTHYMSSKLYQVEKYVKIYQQNNLKGVFYQQFMMYQNLTILSTCIILPKKNSAYIFWNEQPINKI